MMKHCDDYVEDFKQPDCLVWFIFINRLPATLKHLAFRVLDEKPKLFADFKGQRVRVVMASRLGDVGITYDLSKENGYDTRVYVEELDNFSDVE